MLGHVSQLFIPITVPEVTAYHSLRSAFIGRRLAGLFILLSLIFTVLCLLLGWFSYGIEDSSHSLD